MGRWCAAMPVAVKHLSRPRGSTCIPAVGCMMMSCGQGALGQALQSISLSIQCHDLRHAGIVIVTRQHDRCLIGLGALTHVFDAASHQRQARRIAVKDHARRFFHAWVEKQGITRGEARQQRRAVSHGTRKLNRLAQAKLIRKTPEVRLIRTATHDVERNVRTCRPSLRHDAQASINTFDVNEASAKTKTQRRGCRTSDLQGAHSPRLLPRFPQRSTTCLPPAQ